VKLDVKPFRCGTDKEAALKPLEEAAEVFGSWQTFEGMHSMGAPDGIDNTNLARLADELADTITACANLAARYGLDLQDALDRVERRNRERGRYV